MIKLNPRPEPPTILSSNKVIETKRNLEEKIQSGQKLSNTKPNDFPPHWNPEARKELWIHQKHKCCYCERKRGEKRESDLEHFRPKAGIEGEVHPGYWWLAYDWNNYLYSCKPCNEEYKKNKFPLMDNGVRAQNKDDDLNAELPILINPYDENPEELINYHWEDENSKFVIAIGSTNDVNKRGKNTIEILGLNEENLPEERANILINLYGLATMMIAFTHLSEHGHKVKTSLSKTIKKIQKETSSEKAFCGFRRAFFKKFNLGQFISND